MRSRRTVRRLAVGALALGLSVVGFPAWAAPVDLPPTFTPSTLRARAGQVIGVAGSNCTLNGRGMETASVSFAPQGQNTLTGQAYEVMGNGSWSGWFVLPQPVAPGTGHSIGSSCSAADMFVNGPDYDFEVLPGAAPVLSVAARGAVVEAAGSGCVDGGRALSEATVFVEPERKGRYQPGGFRRPLPEPSARPTVAADGSFRAEVGLPGPGRWEVYSRCWSGDLTLESAFHQVDVAGPSLATTGGTGAAAGGSKGAGGKAGGKFAAGETPGAAAGAGDPQPTGDVGQEGSGVSSDESTLASRPARAVGRDGSSTLALLSMAAVVAGGAAGAWIWRRRRVVRQRESASAL